MNLTNKSNNSPIYAYSQKELKKIDAFIENEYGPFSEVIHEIYSPDIHLDIAVVPPTDEQPYYKLVTMGAGAYKMNVPEELKKYKLERAEYVIFLPKEWDIKSDKEEYYWAIHYLKSLARLPIDSNSWLGFGHTVSANNDSSPVAANTKFNSFVLFNSYVRNKPKIQPMKLNLFEKINFYQLYPLYQEELEFKMENSLEDLVNKIDEKDLSFIVNINRKNYCLPQDESAAVQKDDRTEKPEKNNDIKITGTSSYIDVEIDNKVIRIPGELGSGYFLCYDECITEWLKPEGQAVTPEEKENLIERINEKQKNSKMKILFRNTAGWDAIENEFLRVYPGQNKPLHYGTLIKWSLGGKAPLDGISIYDGGTYWHFVSFGLTELYKKESDDKEISGFGYELTFKLKKDDYEDEEAEIKNVCSILQSIARLTFTNGERFLPNEYIYTGQTEGIDAKQKSNLTGFITIKDPAVETIKTLYGKVEFLELIGMTDAELKTLSTRDSVAEIYKKLESDITDYNRKSLV